MLRSVQAKAERAKMQSLGLSGAMRKDDLEDQMASMIEQDKAAIQV